MEQLIKYKAILVIKGYQEKEGLDYFDTYSHVSRITSIRMILAIAALRNIEVHQMDVRTSFLNGDLDEEIYMEQPEGHVVSGQERKKFDKDDSGKARTPIDTSQDLSKNKGQNVDQVEYARVIDSLISCTRPDIALLDLDVLEGSFNACWIYDIQCTKGTSGYVFTLEG
ncbi:hypothetical protein V6N11_036800 [Hibiscus sabdariffa]|uniref:Reverse transcriptase Ty1/copia-type domain-containing protein n=1 Tax=Hibiscus sabdariffa TaxID=183260 RepID=A0ABR2RBJ3_9ROSI